MKQKNLTNKNIIQQNKQYAAKSVLSGKLAVKNFYIKKKNLKRAV